MIRNHDRSGWFGASDTAMVMGRWDTATFRRWWAVKLGVYSDVFTNAAMRTGTRLEIPIIRAINTGEGQRIRLGKYPRYRLRYRVRANYDGITRREIIEIKTARVPFAKVPASYWQQCQVLMWACRRRRAVLYLYQPQDIDYTAPYFPHIDRKRLHRFEIAYDPAFIESYKRRVSILAWYLRRRRYPQEVA